MCSPIPPESLQGLAFEINSAISALHMEPDSIPPNRQTPDNSGFLADTDYWVKHSIEHLRACLEGLRNIEKDINEFIESTHYLVPTSKWDE